MYMKTSKLEVVRKLIRLEIKRYLQEQKDAQTLEELSAEEKRAQVKADQAILDARKASVLSAQKKLKDTQAAPVDNP